jgi:hypothetical protein
MRLGRYDSYNDRLDKHDRPKKQYLLTTLLALGVAIVVLGGLGFLTALSTVNQQETLVSVGGGPLDSRKPKKVFDPGAGVVVTGLFDKTWSYPANNTQRFHPLVDVSNDEHKTIYVSTRDGVLVGLPGQMLFRFTGDKQELLEFSQGLGARPFNGSRPGESDEGWESFLYTMVSPRRVIDPRRNAKETDSRVVYDNLAKSIEEDLNSRLGGRYIQEVRLDVPDVILPVDVQKNIDAVNAGKARVKAKQQEVRAASEEARRLRILGRATKRSGQAALLEAIKEAKQPPTIILDGTGKGNFSVPAGR